jgi:SpoVK/Ycf46/Vps4 family AAA+-type ATPase
MLRKNKMDPSRINNYNKFLITLDKSEVINTEVINPKIINEYPINEPTSIGKTDQIKSILEKILDKINNNYNENRHNSSNFTGQTTNDILNMDMDIDDPNEYKESINGKEKERNRINRLIFQRSSKKDPYIDSAVKVKVNNKDINILSIKIKETINIETEINSIDDIIQLTEKYKLDPEIKYNINMKALHNIKEPLQELNNMIGMSEMKNNIVDQILYFVQELHKNKSDSGDFMHTVIYGPPGTGKTEIAKMMGKIYSKIGILNKGTFKKVTRSDLIAGYLGQTAMKTRDVIKEALGGVLFIDEAYALGNTDKKDIFSKECIDTLCEALSDNKENLMVIIAGYETELNDCFFNYNQGLNSRFTWRFKTDNYSAEDLHKIFVKKVKDIGWELHEDSKITPEFFKKNYDYLKFFGRDIETVLAKTKIAHSKRVFCKADSEKKKITLTDLEKGFELYLKNDDVKKRKDNENLKKYIYSSIYS